MHSKSRIALMPVSGFTIALLVLAAFALLAGGYAIRFATFGGPAAGHASTVSGQLGASTSGAAGVSDNPAPDCYWVNDHRGC